MGSVFSATPVLTDEQRSVLRKLRRPCAASMAEPCRAAAESMIDLGLVEVSSGSLALTGLGKRIAANLDGS